MQRDIGGKLSFYTHSLFRTSVRGDPIGISSNALASENLEFLGYHTELMIGLVIFTQYQRDNSHVLHSYALLRHVD